MRELILCEIRIKFQPSISSKKQISEKEEDWCLKENLIKNKKTHIRQNSKKKSKKTISQKTKTLKQTSTRRTSERQIQRKTPERQITYNQTSKRQISERKHFKKTNSWKKTLERTKLSFFLDIIAFIGPALAACDTKERQL